MQEAVDGKRRLILRDLNKPLNSLRLNEYLARFRPASKEQKIINKDVQTFVVTKRGHGTIAAD